jgi:uncharacterized membrane protein YhaH (DUF805 family)
MKKRFSVSAFIGATLIHIAGTWALFAAHFRALAEWKRTGVDSHPALLGALAWIWDSLPLLVRRWCDSQVTGKPFATNPACWLFGPSFLIRALCVGVLFGFVVPASLHGYGGHLTRRCSQPLATPTSSFHMTSTLPLQIKLALASGG